MQVCCYAALGGIQTQYFLCPAAHVPKSQSELVCPVSHILPTLWFSLPTWLSSSQTNGFSWKPCEVEVFLYFPDISQVNWTTIIPRYYAAPMKAHFLSELCWLAYSAKWQDIFELPHIQCRTTHNKSSAVVATTSCSSRTDKVVLARGPVSVMRGSEMSQIPQCADWWLMYLWILWL